MLSAFTSHFNDAEPPRAKPLANAAICGSVHTGARSWDAQVHPFTDAIRKLSRWPASTLARFADRDPIDGMACVVGAIKKAPHCHHTVYTICSQKSTL
jgi:hypothetical protein